ncbi:FkbM family methyltransferase [Candidatus Dependentiae bacterium]|nr:FkbM family methyltransferase [Candidatus Dependentiae bacterium]
MYQRKITKEFIKQFLPENPIILEAGAHKGRDTVEMAKLWPQGKIYAFEPVEKLYKKLHENTLNYSNIIISNYALSNKSGQEIFYDCLECDAVGSLFEPYEIKIKRPGLNFKKIYVKTLTLDDWAKEFQIEKIDFAWLDMQGAELKVLKASNNILKSFKLIQIEVNLCERFKYAPAYDEIKSWFRDQGYKILLEDFHHNDWGDVLFIKE